MVPFHTDHYEAPTGTRCTPVWQQEPSNPQIKAEKFNQDHSAGTKESNTAVCKIPAPPPPTKTRGGGGEKPVC